MKRVLAIGICITLLLIMSCKTDQKVAVSGAPILMDITYLELTQQKLINQDPSIEAAYQELIKDAERALSEGPYTVTDKEKLPPSGDQHDYASYSRYWWPDPNQPDGLPYIRKDGETNPASQSLQESDRQRIGALGRHTESLGLAYYFTGEEKYAIKAAELLRIWFLNPETRMNPKLNHAQCRPGHNTGSKSGVLDGRLMIRALEGSLLISNSSALSESEQKGLKDWASDYFEWLTTSELALAEAASRNNHGSYYDVQAIYFALYADHSDAAKDIAHQFIERRLDTQIEADGSMPEEMARTRPLFYSIYNLHAMFTVAHLAEQVDIDLWKADELDSPLRAALDYLLPYTDPNKPWPHPTISEADRMDMFPLLLMANQAYPNNNYLHRIEKLPIERRRLDRANLVLPVMR